VSGTWEWDVVVRNADGDTRTEQEEWYLRQRGNKVEGYYDRVLTVESGDGRPFVCYEATRYQKFTRFRVEGSIEGSRIHLREMSYETPPDPCDRGGRTMTSYDGIVHGPTMTLRWPPAGLQVLRRKTLPGQAPGPMRPFPAARAPSGPKGLLGTIGPAEAMGAALVPGLWVREAQRVDANGNLQTLREEWDLEQQGERVFGRLVRTLRTVSMSGTPFSCSGRAETTVVARARIEGTLHGRRITLREEHESLLQGAACASALPTMTGYEGLVGEAEMLLLVRDDPETRLLLRRMGPGHRPP